MHNYFHHFGHASSGVQSTPLFQTFIVELFVGLLVAALATWFVPSYLEWRKLRKSKMYLCLPDRSATYQLFKRGNDYNGMLKLQIKNSSPFSLKEVAIKLYLSPGYKVEIKDKTNDGEVTLLGGLTDGTVISCLMNRSIHPHRYHHFPCTLELKINEDSWAEENSFLYYYFSTEFGLFPKSAELINEEGRQVQESDMENFLKLPLKRP